MQMQDRSPKDRSPRPYSFHQAQWYGPQRRTWCEQFPDGPIPHGHLGKSPSFRSRPLRVCLASLERPPLHYAYRHWPQRGAAPNSSSTQKPRQKRAASERQFRERSPATPPPRFGLDRQQNDVGAFDRFAIVGG